MRRRRRPAPDVPAETPAPTPIERFLPDGVGQGPPVFPVTMPICPEGYTLSETGVLRVQQATELAARGDPRMMVFDVDLQAWRPIGLAPGVWQLSQLRLADQPGPSPKLPRIFAPDGRPLA